MGVITICCSAPHPNESALLFLSCMTLICALQKMKKLFKLTPILLSAMEIWQMLGRYSLGILDGSQCSSIHLCGSNG